MNRIKFEQWNGNLSLQCLVMARQLIVTIAESAERRRATTKKQSHRQSERTVANVVVAENWTNYSVSNLSH
jgi:hypothetical protein